LIRNGEKVIKFLNHFLARFNLDQLNKEYGIANKKIAEKKKANK